MVMLRSLGETQPLRMSFQAILGDGIVLSRL